MCGRYTLTFSINELRAAFPDVIFEFEAAPRYNVAPAQPIPVIRREASGDLKADKLQWGLIPPWAKDPKIGYKLINARAETLADKPSFRSAFKYRRCLIPADGFFEWLIIRETEAKQPIYFQLKTKEAFSFAGLWESWLSPAGENVQSATIITTTPNSLVSKFHDRMPVILPREKYQGWLAPQADPKELQSMLRPYSPEKMEARSVSTMVNNAKVDSPEILTIL